MSEKTSLTRSQAVEQVIAAIDGPVAVDEVCEQILAIRPSKAKNPLRSMRNFLRQEQAGWTLVFLDAQTIVPLPVAFRGARFRIALTRSEVKRGVVIIRPAFDYFLRNEVDPTEVQLLDQRGHRLPVRQVTTQVQVETPFGRRMTDVAAYDLAGWFRTQHVRRGDSILVTIEDWTAGCFRLEPESSRRCRRAEMERQDRELAGELFNMLEGAHRELIFAHEAVPTAYARLSDPHGYPGNHWIAVVGHDERMLYDGWAIRYSDWRPPLERALFEEESMPAAVFSPTQGQQVYRFKVVLWHRPGLWRRIEIQGEQTLAEFDAILRDAFEHDPSDHLGGFWKRIRRGKGKRFREVEAGTVDPLGEGSGAEIAVAGLGLEPGHELKYVYDFGDWIEHRITLEEITEPEAGIQYPHIIAQNRPQYKDCESCLAQGRKSRATWICIECSSQQQREVLVCEECLDREHEEHFAEEILY
jgi:hypothetical protein